MNNRQKHKLNIFIRAAVHAGCLLPLFVLIVQFFTDNLTANPIQAAEQRTGDITLILLLITLSITPLVVLSGFTLLTRQRRTFGLYTFMYAAIHLVLFVGLDYGFNPGLFWPVVVQKTFIIVGLAAFAGLLLLAATSFQWWMRRLGRGWKALHRLVYLIGFLAVLHFAWALKGDILRLSGDIQRPLIAGGVLITLLLVRLPFVRRRVVGLREALKRKYNKQSETDGRDKSAPPTDKSGGG